MKKINNFLASIHNKKVDSFHYTQEDGDMTYANKDTFCHSDFIYSLKYKTPIFVYFDDTCWFNRPIIN